MTNKAPSWIGKTLSNRYQIEELLGQGGMSAVYKAHDPNLKRSVAIKLIHSHLTEREEFIRRFEQEATAVAQLRHNNIVQVHDFNHHGDIYYMVLEYLTGETLDKKLNALNEAGLRLPLTDTIRIVATICDAIDYAHQRRMIHRDLKPANIMLDLLSEPILMDFGIAKIIGGNIHTQTGAAIGTAAYMSPEQVRGHIIDYRSDIYALGIILYEMLSGNPPFQSDSSSFEVMRQHVEKPVPDIRQVNANTPNSLVGIIEKALSKNPDNRYQTAVEMANALRTAAVHVQSPTDTLAARHLDRLSMLWQQAQDSFDDRKYAACLDRLEELKRADADYKQDQVSQLRQEAFNRLYGRAVKYFQSGRLNESSRSAQELRQRDPEYPGLDQLESSIRQGMQDQKAKAKLQRLYDEAVKYLDIHQYEKALERWNTIQLEPGSFSFPDKLHIEKRAKQGIAGNLYTEALSAWGQADANQALRLWQQVQQHEPDFPDKQNLVAQIKQTQRRRHTAVLRIGGGAILIIALLATAYFIFGNGGGRTDVTPAPTETIVVLADTHTNTPAPTTAPTETAVPTATSTSHPTDTPTPKPSHTPSASPSSTPEVEATPNTLPDNQAIVLEPSSIFTAPESGAAVVTILRVDDAVKIIGRSINSRWFYVHDQNGNAGFVFQDLIQWDGDITTLRPYIGISPIASPSSVTETSLKFNFWELNVTRCGSGGMWYESVFFQGEGGNGIYTYYWNDVQVGGPTSGSFTFELSSDGGPIIGTGKITSGSQTETKDLFISAPDC